MSDLKVWGMMTRTRRGIADDDGSAGEVPQFKISRLNRRHISPTKPLTQGMALLRCVSPLLAQSGGPVIVNSWTATGLRVSLSRP